MKHILNPITCALSLACFVGSSWAVYPGVKLLTSSDNLIEVPGSNGVMTDAWKLVNTHESSGERPNGCSSFQISKDFILSSHHCRLENGTFFTNAFKKLPGGRSGVDECKSPIDDGLEYALGGPNDIRICRLTNPEVFNAPAGGVYPMLAIRPEFGPKDASTQGLLLAFGRGKAGPQLNFVRFDGTPINVDESTGTVKSYKVYEDPITLGSGLPINVVWPDGTATKSLSSLIPQGVNIDSSGAVFWYSPVTFKPAVVGVMTEGESLNHAASYFTPETFQWLKAKVQAVKLLHPSVELPIFGDTSTHLGPKVAAVPMLTEKPKVSRDLQKTTGTWVTATWAAPASPSGVTISSYRVSLVGGGLSTPKVDFISGTNWSVPLPSVGDYELCAVPHAGDRASSELYMFSGRLEAALTYDRPNCTTIYGRAPAAPTSLALKVAASTTATFRKVSASWMGSVGNPVPGLYTIIRGVTAPGSTIERKTTLTNPATNTSLAALDVLRGSKVCVSVNATEPIFGLTSALVKQCVLAN